MKRKKRAGRKLTKAERRAIALRNLAKAHRGRRRKKNPAGKGYRPRKLSRRRFKKPRVAIKRFGRNRGQKFKSLAAGERRRGRRRRRKNPYHPRSSSRKRFKKKRTVVKRYGRNRGRRVRALTVGEKRRGRKRGRKTHHLTKRQRAARKGAATRRRNKRMREEAARKGARKRGRRKGGHRAKGRRKSSAGHRKSPKRVRAGKKAAATRARNRSRGPRKRSRRHTLRYGGRFVKYTPPSHQLTAERRRRRRRRNPLANPLPNPLANPTGFLMNAAGFGFGFLFQDAIDRWAATHALATDSAGNVTDSPAIGQIFDSEAPQLPLWGSMSNPNWMRLGLNLAGLAVPGLLSRWVARDFLQRWFIAATVRTIGKVATDAVAAFAPANATTLRLYGGEYAANTRLSQTTTTAPTTSPAGVFAGTPRNRQLAAPRQTAARPLGSSGDCGCGTTPSGLLTDPLAGSAALANQIAPAISNCNPCLFNPLTAGTGPAGDTIDMTPVSPVFSTSGGGSGSGSGGGTTTTTTTTSGGGSGSGSGGGTTTQAGCDQNTINSLFGQLGTFNGTGPTPNQAAYNAAAAQLANCGISSDPWTPPSTSSSGGGGTTTTTTPAPSSSTVVVNRVR